MLNKYYLIFYFELLGAQRIENPFWNDASRYNNINWSYPDEEDICGLEMPSIFNVGQELYVGMELIVNMRSKMQSNNML